MVKFILRDIAVGIPTITPRYVDMDTLTVYEITSTLFWYLYRKLHAENEMTTQQGASISRDQQVIIYR